MQIEIKYGPAIVTVIAYPSNTMVIGRGDPSETKALAGLIEKRLSESVGPIVVQAIDDWEASLQ
jgi:hypothetical protein